jgi:hypothetical protein
MHAAVLRWSHPLAPPPRRRRGGLTGKPSHNLQRCAQPSARAWPTTVKLAPSRHRRNLPVPDLPEGMILACVDPCLPARRVLAARCQPMVAKLSSCCRQAAALLAEAVVKLSYDFLQRALSRHRTTASRACAPAAPIVPCRRRASGRSGDPVPCPGAPSAQGVSAAGANLKQATKQAGRKQRLRETPHPMGRSWQEAQGSCRDGS